MPSTTPTTAPDRLVTVLIVLLLLTAALQVGLLLRRQKRSRASQVLATRLAPEAKASRLILFTAS